MSGDQWKCGDPPRRLLQVRAFELSSKKRGLAVDTRPRECFFPMVSAKFRRILKPTINAPPNGTPTKGLKPAGDLCIGFSGGLGSTVLLDLVSESYFSPLTGEDALKGGKDHPRNANVWKKATVCYVEICNALPGVWSILFCFRDFHNLSTDQRSY